MLLRILTFFKWVYGNPLTFLVGIRRIPAYHVDYTTGLNTNNFMTNLYDFDKRVNTCSILLSDKRVSEA